ncbi:hypothetical protein [Paenibacillus radicis (ex Xue et al. 2023)]|uniref:Uncharacterized protein n=1 Tax=Paenibacillus radicis (ex Xue et al. 2023) TaxID=2972489 RepID=A0ABT1YFI0_9BACL|nr:hypothetical protein [Paenibacillus radicis (ex Xue et al. 2023)]MCR8631169.1 hypothetical protein [Paenibacillus radicis (ex Xue et al. 2023)]
MIKSTLWLVSLVIWTSLMLPLPLSNAAVSSSVPLTTAVTSSPNAAASTAPSASTNVTVPAPAPVQPDNSLSSPSLMDAIKQWVQSISVKPGYEAWKQATWTSQPLGPGTHGWIVLLQSDGKPVGYMVIHAADPNNPTKYRLTEYGNGNTPLFSMQTLYQSLVQLELMDTSYQADRLYTSPLQAVWKVTSGENLYYIDGKTGEILPPLATDSGMQGLDRPNEEQLFSLLKPEHTITASVQLPEFDPYERLPWVKGTPLQYESTSALLKDLDLQKKLTYTAQLYRNKVTVPLAVTGYHQWSNNEVFLLLEQAGQRAIPYDTAFKLGKLYP